MSNFSIISDKELITVLLPFGIKCFFLALIQHSIGLLVLYKKITQLGSAKRLLIKRFYTIFYTISLITIIFFLGLQTISYNYRAINVLLMLLAFLAIFLVVIYFFSLFILFWLDNITIPNRKVEEC